REHVDGRLRADLEAGFRGAERRAARLHRLPERRYARDVRDHAEIRVAGLALGLPRDALERLRRRPVLINRLLDPRPVRAARVDREPQVDRPVAALRLLSG